MGGVHGSGLDRLWKFLGCLLRGPEELWEGCEQGLGGRGSSGCRFRAMWGSADCRR